MNGSNKEVVHGNSVPEMEFESGRVLKPGMRVSVKSRHGTTGTGVIKDLRVWKNCPPTVVLEMDADTQWSQKSQAGWPLDIERLPTLGVWGGEIESVLEIN